MDFKKIFNQNNLPKKLKDSDSKSHPSNLFKISNKIDIKQILGFSKKVDSVMLVDIGSKLTMLNIQLGHQLKVNSMKSVEFTDDNRDEIIINSLQDFIQEHDIQHKNVILRPDLVSLQLKRIQLPAVPDKELLGAIKWELKETVPYDLSKAVLDFRIIAKITKEDNSKALDIICFVAEEDEIRQQVSLLKQLGLTCLTVGVLQLGYVNLIAQLAEQENEPIGLLHLENNITYLCVYLNNKLAFYREIPVSVNSLKVSLKSVLVSDKGKIELSPEELEEVLFTIGIPKKDAVYKEKLSSIQILSMLRPHLERMVNEIKRSLTYYTSHFGEARVKKLLIAGFTSRIPNLDEFLANELSLNISRLPLSEKFIVSSEVDPELLFQVSGSLGLVLDYEKNINLLPFEFRTEKLEKLEKVSLRWVTFLVFLLLIISYFFARVGVAAYKKGLDTSVIYFNTLSEIRKVNSRLGELKSFVTDVRNKDIPAYMILKKLSAIAPKELFFNHFSLDNGSRSGTIRGYVKNTEKNPDVILTKFIRSMQASYYFTNTDILSVKKSKGDAFDLTNFDITFKLQEGH
ncbi:MAG: pilus assembly protein PilM [Candidatus Omnitrophota bacterium]